MKTTSYKDLIVWQKSIELVIMIYELTKKFPKEELYGLVSQMRRAAVSISSAIAEGYTRRNRKEYIQSLYIARSSTAELETQLLITHKLGYLDKKSYKTVSSLLEEVAKLLSSIVSKLREQ